jgi:hypothetical protein
MSEPNTGQTPQWQADRPRRRKWRRILLVIGLLVPAAVGSIVGLSLYQKREAERQLREVIAQTDCQDNRSPSELAQLPTARFGMLRPQWSLNVKDAASAMLGLLGWSSSSPS